MSTSMPEPSGFRCLNIANQLKATILAGRLIKESIDFHYSDFNGLHQFVYPVKHDKRMKQLAESLT